MLNTTGSKPVCVAAAATCRRLLLWLEEEEEVAARLRLNNQLNRAGARIDTPSQRPIGAQKALVKNTKKSGRETQTGLSRPMRPAPGRGMLKASR